MATTPAGYSTINDPSADPTYDTEITAINGSDQVIGYYEDDNDVGYGFVENNGVYTEIDDPNDSIDNGSIGTEPMAINISGEIAGDYSDSNSENSQGFITTDGVNFTTIDDPSAVYGTYITAINDSGEVAGYYIDAGFNYDSFIHAGTDATAGYTGIDDPLGVNGTLVAAINNSGALAGNYFDSNFVSNGFISTDGVNFTTIDDPSAAYGTTVTAINASGEVAGYYQDSAGIDHGFIYDNGTYTDIDDGSDGTFVTGINAKGEVSGYYYDAANNDANQAFVYSNGTYTDVGPENENYYDNAVIDNSGDVAGEYTDGNGVQQGFSATADQIACYCHGTSILTTRGETKVEDLVIGDEVITFSGAARPVKWIGRRGYNGRFIIGKKDILPICIKAGALDASAPRRDLWISPHHAMYLNGILIEARDLVNGITIVQAERIDRVDYFHIELETHDVISAEGAWSETFLDDDSRGMFQNAHEYAALHPTDEQRSSRYFAPRYEDGEQLETVRNSIMRRASCHKIEAPNSLDHANIDVPTVTEAA